VELNDSSAVKRFADTWAPERGHGFRCIGGVSRLYWLLGTVGIAALAACSSASTQPQSVGAPDPLAVAQPPPTTIAAQPSVTTAPGVTRLEPSAGLAEAWRGMLPDLFAERPFDVDHVINDGSTLVVASYRNVVAYDIASGSMLWRSPLSLSSLARPIADRIVNGLLVAVTDARVLSAFNIRTGGAVWTTHFPAATACSSLGAPRTTSAFVFIAKIDECRGSTAPAEIAAVDLPTGNVTWERTLEGTGGNAIHAPPLATESMVVVGATVGNVDQREGRKDAYFALDARTGTRRWVTQFDRHPDNGVILTQAPVQHRDLVVVHQLSLIGDIARPAGIDAMTGALRWNSAIGNDVLVDGVLLGVDLVRQNPQDPLAAIALDASTGQILWRQPQLRGRPIVDLARRHVLYTSAQVIAVDPRSGSSRWSVPVADDLPRPILFKFAASVDDMHVLVFTTTPLSNVGTPRTNMQLINLTTGEVLADLDHEFFTAGYEIVGDNVFLIGSTGPTDPSPIIGYQLVRR
jgi:outer membrane protein assembly factor BamB